MNNDPPFHSSLIGQGLAGYGGKSVSKKMKSNTKLIMQTKSPIPSESIDLERASPSYTALCNYLLYCQHKTKAQLILYIPDLKPRWIILPSSQIINQESKVGGSRVNQAVQRDHLNDYFKGKSRSRISLNPITLGTSSSLHFLHMFSCNEELKQKDGLQFPFIQVGLKKY